MGEITSASAEQTAGIGQINVAVAQMDQVTQQNAALVEQAAAAAEAMREQARVLAASVGVFRLAARPAPHTAPQDGQYAAPVPAQVRPALARA
jgi:methyl-accepting chemotaxis protein-1 (serine sensor receptor)